jgi:hypothetical protein
LCPPPARPSDKITDRDQPAALVGDAPLDERAGLQLLGGRELGEGIGAHRAGRVAVSRR